MIPEPDRRRRAVSWRRAALVVAGVALAGAAGLFLLDVRPESVRPSGFDPADLPERPTEASFTAYGEADRLIGFSGHDLRDMDLRQLSPGWLAAQTFDSRTRWPDPDRLPPGVRPAAWLDAGCDPGLGVRGLQRQGLTGEGVVVAVVDKPMRADHRELAGRLIYHPGVTATGDAERLHFHGIAVASLLAGTRCGVAPGVRVHYFAVPDDGRNAQHYAEVLERIAELNGTLSVERRIRLVVISDGVFPDDRAWSAWQRGVASARAAGAEVLTSRQLEAGGFVWGGAAPGSDVDAPRSYRLALRLRDLAMPTSLTLVPGDYRTRATNAGPDSYAFAGAGGMSWAIPYLGGVVALGLQRDSQLALERALALLQATAADPGEGRRVIDPSAFVRAVQAGGTPPRSAAGANRPD